MALRSTLRIAWRNLGRNWRRTALALAATAIAEFVIVFYQGLFGGYFDAMIATVTGPMVGHVQLHAPNWREDHAADRTIEGLGAKLAAIRAAPGVKSVSARVYAPTLVARSESGEAAMIIGVDPALENASGMLQELAPDKLPKPSQVVLGTALARRLGAREGDELALVGQGSDGSIASGLFQVAAVMDTRVDLINRAGVLMSLDDAASLLALEDRAHEVVVVGADPEQAAALAGTLRELPALEGLEVLGWRQLVPELAQLMDLMWAYELFLMAMVFIAAAAGAANTMVMSTFERTHELGMLLSLGARPRRVVGLVLAESFVLGLIGVSAGMAIGVALVLWTGKTGLDISRLAPGGGGAQLSYLGMKISMVMHPKLDTLGLLRSGVAVLAMSVLAALWPAVRAARLEPAEAVRS